METYCKVYAKQSQCDWWRNNNEACECCAYKFICKPDEISLHLCRGKYTREQAFENKAELIKYVHKLNSLNCVWLLAINEEVHVTEHIHRIIDIIAINDDGVFTVYLQEYPNYKEAYEVALDILKEYRNELVD
jgi:hypothetical protein